MKKIKTLILTMILIFGLGEHCFATTLALPPAATGLINKAGEAVATIGGKKALTAAGFSNPISAAVVVFGKIVTKPVKAGGDMIVEWKYGPVNHWSVTTYDTKTETSEKARHNFKNSNTCKDNCGYICDKYKSSNWSYKFKDGTISTKFCVRYCGYKDHDHGTWYERKINHSNDGNGICPVCKYPCVNGNHNYNSNSVCTKCGYYSAMNKQKQEITQKAEEFSETSKEVLEKAVEVAKEAADALAMKISTESINGYLIVNADHDNIRRDAVKAVVIQLDGNTIFSRDDSVLSTMPVHNGARIVDFGEGEVQIADKRVALIVKPGTELASKIGNVSHNITVKVYDVNKLTDAKWRETTSSFTGTFEANGIGSSVTEDDEPMKISTEEVNGALVINMDHKNINMDNIMAIGIEINNAVYIAPYVASNLPIYNDARISKFRGSEIQFMYQRVALIIKQGEELANLIGNTEKEIILSVHFKKQSIQEEIKVKGIFTIQQPVEQQPVEQQPVEQQPVEQQPVEQQPAEPESSELFNDVIKGSQLEIAIKYVVDKNIMNGVGGGIFDPDGYVTRAQLATILSRTPTKSGLSKKTDRKIYTDAKEFKEWASEAITYFGAFIEDSKHFAPNVKVTKKETILALVKMFRLDSKTVIADEVEKEVKDVISKENIKNADDDLKASLGLMLQYKILQKDEDGKFNLESNITRGEMATLIYKFFTTEIELVEQCTQKNCDGFILDKWEANRNYHWKKCTKGHKIVTETAHDKNAQVCSVCNYDKKAGKFVEGTSYIEPTYRCGKCNGAKAIWKQKETMHIAVCSKDNSHILKIEEHRLDGKNQCTVCGMISNKVYNVVYDDYKDSSNWAWKNVGNMVEKGILRPEKNNDGLKLLEPNENITFEQFIALLSRALGYEEQNIQDGSLYIPMKGINDFWSENEWKYLMQQLGSSAQNEVKLLLAEDPQKATDKEIAYNYKTSITREKVAYLLGGFFESKESDRNMSNEENFVDWNEVNGAYKYRLHTLSAYDILRGKVKDDEKLYVAPKDYLTKLEAIALIDRFYSVKHIGVEY